MLLTVIVLPRYRRIGIDKHFSMPRLYCAWRTEWQVQMIQSRNRCLYPAPNISSNTSISFVLPHKLSLQFCFSTRPALSHFHSGKRSQTADALIDPEQSLHRVFKLSWLSCLLLMLSNSDPNGILLRNSYICGCIPQDIADHVRMAFLITNTLSSRIFGS